MERVRERPLFFFVFASLLVASLSQIIPQKKREQKGERSVYLSDRQWCH